MPESIRLLLFFASASSETGGTPTHKNSVDKIKKKQRRHANLVFLIDIVRQKAKKKKPTPQRRANRMQMAGRAMQITRAARPPAHPTQSAVAADR